MRLFVAIDVPHNIKDAIERSVVAPLQPSVEGARWTRPEGRHLTLKFLGETDDALVEDINMVLGDVASRRAPFDAAFDELGGFPTLRRPRVLWLGIGEGAETMRTVATEIEERLEPLGFEPENRPLHPHFTLARFPKPRIIEEMPRVSVPVDRFAVTELMLFRSQLHPKGARYTPLFTSALQA